MNVSSSIEKKMYPYKKNPKSKSKFLECIFTEDYLGASYHNFSALKNHLDLDKSVNILELGAYEGRSAIYMLENFCKHKNSKITTVDWKLNPQKEILEKNIQTYNSNKLKYIEGNFFDVLPKLLVEKNKYDLIYIDGGKGSKTTIFQIALAWQLLEKNGILYMDDYGWGVNPPREERPKEGIDFFLSLYKDDYELIFQNWQVAVIKK